MKKQYIAPALFEYTLRIESQILSTSTKSITDVHVGNKRLNESSSTIVPDFIQSDHNSEAIKWVDGETDEDVYGI